MPVSHELDDVVQPGAERSSKKKCCCLVLFETRSKVTDKNLCLMNFWNSKSSAYF